MNAIIITPLTLLLWITITQFEIFDISLTLRNCAFYNNIKAQASAKHWSHIYPTYHYGVNPKLLFLALPQ